MWNCDKIRDVLPLAVGDDLPAAGMEAVRVHLTRCPGCSLEMSRYRETLDAMRETGATLGRSVRSDDLWGGIEATLAPAGSSPARRILPFPLWAARVRELAAVAAVFAVGIGLGIWGGVKPPSVTRETPEVATTPVLAPSSSSSGFDFSPDVGVRAMPANYALRNLAPSLDHSGAVGVIDTVEIPLPARPLFRIEQTRPVEESDVEMRF